MPTYYHKFVFKQKVIFSNGQPFDGFERVGQDEGCLATDDPNLIKELDANVKANRGGVVKVTAAEYLALQSKKNEPLKMNWREEWKPVGMPLERALHARSLKQGAEPAVAAESKPAAVVAPPAEAVTSFRPKTTVA